MLGEQDVLTDMSCLKPEPMFVHPGFQQYLHEANKFCTEYNKELAALMNQYGIENEGDIACGCLNTVSNLGHSLFSCNTSIIVSQDFNLSLSLNLLVICDIS